MFIRTLVTFVALLTVAVGFTVSSGAPGLPERPRIRGPFPMIFEENRGQASPTAAFTAAGSAGSLRLGAREMAVTVAPPAGSDRGPETLVMALAGSSATSRARGEEAQGSTSYFNGNDPDRWTRQIPSFRRVRSGAVYPGIDAVYYGSDGRLEYDFVVAPGARPDAIRLAFRDGSGEAARLSVADDGDLLIRSGEREFRQSKPVVYQEAAGERQPVEGRYVLLARAEVGFELGAFDPTRPVVIDPVLKYFDDPGAFCTAIAVDAHGFPYVTGSAYREVKPDLFALDSFIRKFSRNGADLIYSLNFGGSATDFTTDIAVDTNGSAYVTGSTDSFDFPTVNALQPELAFNPEGGWYQDAFVVKASPDGADLEYATYLGGEQPENVWMDGGIAVDAKGQAYVVGATTSLDFPVVNALQPELHSPMNFDAFLTDGFVSKLSADGGALVYSTYLGGAGIDAVNDVVVASDGSVALCGFTDSADFPVEAPFQAENSNEFTTDAFVARLNVGGSALMFSTYLGGNFHDSAQGLAIQPSGAITVAGVTNATDFPLVNPFQSLIQPRPIPDIDLIPIDTSPYPDAFVTRFTSDGGALTYSTYLGGTYDDVATEVALDADGNAVVVGFTDSHDFPTLEGKPRDANRFDLDGYVLRLRADGTALLSSALLGNDARSEIVSGVAVNATGDQYATGYGDQIELPEAKIPPRHGASNAGGRLDAAGAAGSQRARPFVSRLKPTTLRGPGKLRVSARRLKFRGRVGQTQRLGLFLLNTGGRAISGTVKAPAAPFRLRGGTGAFTLQAGQTLPLVVEMEPTRAGTFRGRIDILGSKRAQVQLIGKARPPLQ